MGETAPCSIYLTAESLSPQCEAAWGVGQRPLRSPKIMSLSQGRTQSRLHLSNAWELSFGGLDTEDMAGVGHTAACPQWIWRQLPGKSPPASHPSAVLQGPTGFRSTWAVPGPNRSPEQLRGFGAGDAWDHTTLWCQHPTQLRAGPAPGSEQGRSSWCQGTVRGRISPDPVAGMRPSPDSPCAAP